MTLTSAVRIALALATLTLSGIAVAAAPQPGLWWSSAESGRGYSIDAQGGLLVLTVFAYGYDGRMQWYYADGPLSADGTSWSGNLLKFDNGQPMNGAYRPPSATGTDGPVSITFTSRTTANITLPGGRTHAIERQNFGVGVPPNALLGEWLMAYSIGSSTFGDRYNLSQIIQPGTPNGTGIAANSSLTVGAEYHDRGNFAGRIFMARFTSTGTVLNTYVWTLQMEEGRGSYVGASGTLYGMNVYKTHTRTGMAKEIASEHDLRFKDPAGPSQPKARTIAEIAETEPHLAEALQRMWEKLSQAR